MKCCRLKLKSPSWNFSRAKAESARVHGERSAKIHADARNPSGVEGKMQERKKGNLEA